MLRACAGMVVAMMLLAGAAACQSNMPHPHPNPSGERVPELPPNGVPDSLYHPSKWMTGGPTLPGTFLRDIVVVLFMPGTPQPERQAAVDMVRGRVVGGRPLPGGDGDGSYFIRIPGDESDEPLKRAIEALKSLPQVVSAHPEYMDSLLSPI